MMIVPPSIPIQSFSIHGHSISLLFRRLSSQSMPHIHYSSSARGEHAVLQTVEVLAVDWRYEFASGKTQKDAWRQIVLADTIAELEVLVEHSTECKRDGLKVYVRGRWWV